jgi:hypothetical protein
MRQYASDDKFTVAEAAAAASVAGAREENGSMNGEVRPQSGNIDVAA